MSINSPSLRLLRVLIVITGILLLVFFNETRRSSSDVLDYRMRKIATANSTGLPLHLPPGFSISVFAKNLGDPQTLAWDPEGNLLVAVPSRGRIIALRDRNNDGVVDGRATIADGLSNPKRMAIRCGGIDRPELYAGFFVTQQLKTAAICKLYIQDNTSLVTFDYSGKKIIAANKNILSDEADESLLSTAFAADEYGLCSTNQADFQSITALFCPDPAVKFSSGSEDHIYQGVVKIPAYGWPEDYGHNMVVAYPSIETDSWKDDYKIVRYKFDENQKYLGQSDFITGWRTPRGRVIGRPADIIVQSRNGKYISDLYISDSLNGAIYRVSYRGVVLTDR